MIQKILLSGIFVVMVMLSSAQADVTRSEAQKKIHAAREVHHESVMKLKKEELESLEDAPSKEVVVVTRNPEKKKVPEAPVKKSSVAKKEETAPKTKEECAVMKNVKEKEACYKSLKEDKKKEVKESTKATTTK